MAVVASTENSELLYLIPFFTEEVKKDVLIDFVSISKVSDNHVFLWLLAYNFFEALLLSSYDSGLSLIFLFLVFIGQLLQILFAWLFLLLHLSLILSRQF